MATNIFQQIQEGLSEKRKNLSAWVENAPSVDKETHLAVAGEAGLQSHLEVITDSLHKAGEHNIGVCEICQGYVNEDLLAMDYTSSVCLDHLSEKERRQLETELELSRLVQKALLPQQPPKIPGLDLAAYSRPAQIVGGDYYDFFQFQDGHQGLAIADVEGHGVSSGMLMTSLQTSLRTLVPEYTSPVDVLQRINRFYLHNIQFTTFVTVFLGSYDPGQKCLTYCNAGHNPPLLIRSAGRQMEWLEPTGAAIGLVEDYSLTSSNVIMKTGDTLLLYTDGVTEATNEADEQFGQARLEAVAQQERDQSAERMIWRLRQALYDFAGNRPVADDTTLVAFRILN
jgi:sigma-B regulation protein RsbU (phosphoserine phosphatase)